MSRAVLESLERIARKSAKRPDSSTRSTLMRASRILLQQGQLTAAERRSFVEYLDALLGSPSRATPPPKTPPRKKRSARKGFEQIEAEYRRNGWRETLLGWISPDGKTWHPK